MSDVDFVSANTIQLTRFGSDFDYKMANRHAWLYCTGNMLTISVPLTILIVTLIDDSFGYDLLLEVFCYISASYHLNHVLTAPLLTYIYMMRNLQKRYAVLIQLLRYVIDFSENLFLVWF